MLANKIFIYLIIKIMPKDKFKAKIVFFLNNITFLFKYNMRITILDQFLNLKLFYINNFQVNTSIIVEV